MSTQHSPVGARSVARALLLNVFVASLFGSLIAAVPAFAQGGDDDALDNRGASGFCSSTAETALRACQNEVRDDFWIAIGNCINESDPEERQKCKAEARAEKRDGQALCGEQLHARLQVCNLIGEARYDPDFDPANFTAAFINLNAYFPLQIGNKWVYEGGGETITVEVLDKTKLIEGVTCIVVNDVVTEDGNVIEDTDDWYAQATNGDIHYCGEIARNFEFFDGDIPGEPELVDIEGSWKAGRDGEKSGIIMFALPPLGLTYRQEFSLGNAEDVAELLSIDYGFGTDPDLDQFVPPALAGSLCNNNCVVTRDFTPIEPGVEERKYFAPGIGLFLEVNVETGETVQLVGCNLRGCPPLL